MTRYGDGAIREMTIWRLPEVDEERPHGLKYNLFYGKNGQRLVGYDNERGKGDNCYDGDAEYPYPFTTAAQLIADFEADIRRRRNE